MNIAEDKLLQMEHGTVDLQECHELLVDFEQYTEIITDPPQQYVSLMEKLGITPWMNQTDAELHGHVVIADIDRINELINHGSQYKLKQTIKLVDKLRKRLEKLTKFYMDCDEKIAAIEDDGNKKKYDLAEYKRVIQTANDLKIDIETND